MLKSKCYKYDDGVYLLDLVINDKYKKIDLMKFYVPEDNLDKDYWQVPYMEQFFDIEEDIKICETYDEPSGKKCPVRILFFIFESSGKVLKTPYGNVELSFEEDVPLSIKEQIEFEPVD